jgi:NAD(P)-dependent dehydrogenase (short-subunit alcohol dehydrogenase family)
MADEGGPSVGGVPDGAHQLDGQVALVTGGSRGLGRRMAEVLAAAGAHVITTSRSADGPEAGLARPVGDAGGTVATKRCDSGHEEDVRRLVDGAVAAYGRIDVLVNNAAMRLSTKLLETSTESMERIFRTNVLGPYFLWRHAIPVMIDGDGGSVINVSSTNAPRQPFVGMAPYRMTKVALTYLSVDLASELESSTVAVNAFDPGPVVSEGTAAIREERAARYGPIAHHEQDPVEVIDEPVLWLAQQRGPAFTGQAVRRVDFGITWGPQHSRPVARPESTTRGESK